MNVWQARNAIVEVGRWCYERGFIVGHDGNLSCRVGKELIAATPTALCKGRLRPEDIVILDLGGRRVEGNRSASSEILLHLAIYQERPDVGGVVHAHPPVATGFAVARLPLAQCVLPEIVVSLGSVPLAPYATPATSEVPESIRPKLKTHNAFLLANHGTVTLGPTLTDAYYTLEKVEQFAKVMLVARQLGRVTVLNRDEVQKLLSTMGVATEPPCDTCGVCGDEPTCGESETEIKEIVAKIVKRLEP